MCAWLPCNEEGHQRYVLRCWVPLLFGQRWDIPCRGAGAQTALNQLYVFSLDASRLPECEEQQCGACERCQWCQVDQNLVLLLIC